MEMGTEYDANKDQIIAGIKVPKGTVKRLSFNEKNGYLAYMDNNGKERGHYLNTDSGRTEFTRWLEREKTKDQLTL